VWQSFSTAFFCCWILVFHLETDRQEILTFLQIIAQLLAERLIPFVVLDVRSERVSVGRALDLPVYFGDAGSREVPLLFLFLQK
jgi:hypothetical protein